MCKYIVKFVGLRDGEVMIDARDSEEAISWVRLMIEQGSEGFEDMRGECWGISARVMDAEEVYDYEMEHYSDIIEEIRSEGGLRF